MVTTVKFVTSTVTVSEPSPTVIDVVYSAQCPSICQNKFFTIPPPHRWSLRGQCLVLVPTLILSYALMEKFFSMRLLERLWVRLVTVLWHREAKKQPKLKKEKVISIARAYHEDVFAKVRYREGTWTEEREGEAHPQRPSRSFSVTEKRQDKIETDDEAATVPLIVECFAETLVEFSRIVLVQVIIVCDL